MKKHRYYSITSFLSYIQQFTWRFVIVIASFVLSNACLAIIPIFIGKLVGALAHNPINNQLVVLYVGILLACSIGHDWLWRLSEILYMKLLNPVVYGYETVMFRHVIQKPYPYFVDKFTGKLSANIGTLGQEFRDFISNICYNYTSNLVSLVGIIFVLATVNWQTTLIFAIAIVCMFITGRYTIKNANGYEKRFTDTQSTKTGKIVDAIANFVNIKSFQKEQAEIASIHEEQLKTTEAANKSYFWNIIFWASMSLFVRELIWPITIVLNVYLFLHHQISLAQLTTFLSAVLVFSNFVWEIIWNVSQFNLRLARIEEAHHYLFGNKNVFHEVIANEQLQEPIFNKELALHKLSFAYPDMKDTPVLDNVELSIKKGQKIGIVGKSGSGKSTLTKILLGYYQLSDEPFQVDGQLLKPKELATLIAYVPQDTTLFHRSIAENIAYATNHAVTREEIMTAAKHAHADEFIRKIPGGYDALVGERGVKLSVGQRQRIAIARAFLDNKPILILDEATSALDSESEVLVQDALESLWEDKTVIAIAHRLSTLRHMDHIIVMDKGKIIEQGSHDALLKKNGTYARLWSHQSGGFIEE